MKAAKNLNWRCENIEGELRPVVELDGVYYIPTTYQRLSKNPKSSLWNEDRVRTFPISDENVTVEYTMQKQTGWRTDPILIRDYCFVIPEEVNLRPVSND